MILIVYAFVVVIMVLFGVMVVAYMWLRPVLPYLKAKWAKKDIVVMIGKDNKVRLIPAKYSTGMFTVSDPPYSFIQRVPKAYRLGELNAVFIHDGWGVVVDPDMLETLKVLSDRGYTTYEALEEALKSTDEATRLEHSDLIRIHAFKDIDFDVILNYIADVAPSQLRAHIDEKMAMFVEEYVQLGEDKGGSSGFTIFMVLGLVLTVVIGTKVMGMW